MRLQPVLCSKNQALLLVMRNAGGSTAEVGIAAQADLDENDSFAIFGNQIDLAAAHTKIARNDFQTARLQVFCRNVFGRCAGHGFIGYACRHE